MNKKLIWGIVMAVVVVVLGAAIFYYKNHIPVFDQNMPGPDGVTSTPIPKTYTDAKHGYSFQHPEKLTLETASGSVTLSHTIPFENRDGGCDMMGDVELSKTLTDFSVQFEVLPGEVKPPYVDGPYSAGELNGNYAYMGAEGCGQSKYYFPVSGNRTLVVTKNELQVLSPVVSAEVRNKVLAVPGVIPYEAANAILKNILSSFKFTSPALPSSTNSQPSVTVLSPNGGEVLKFGDTNSITWNYAGLDNKDTLTIGFRNRVGTGSACWIKGIPVGNKKLEYIAGKVLCENGVKIMSGDQYKIELIVDKYNTGRGVADTSNNYFTFTTPVSAVQPSIVVTSPNGGEIYRQGDLVNISWNSTNISENRDLEITLSDSQGTYVKKIMPLSHPNYVPFPATNHSYQWRIDSTVSPGVYKITVVGTFGFDNSTYDRSDATFTITN